MNATRTTTLAALVSGALLLGACGAQTPVSVTDPPAPTAPQSETVTPAPPAAEPSPVEPGPSTVENAAPFGKTVTWADGLAITVSQPRFYKPVGYSLGGKKWNVAFDITVKNGTADRYDPTLLSLIASDAKGDLESLVDEKVGGRPQGSLRPGKAVTFTEAYGLNANSITGLTVDVTAINPKTYETYVATFEN